MNTSTRQHPKSFRLVSALTAALLATTSAFAAQSTGGQASITLAGGSAVAHQYTDTAWSLTKTSSSVVPAAAA
jgi:hypothetical protein